MEYRQINLTEWEESGAGGTAKSYFHKTDSSIMLKVFTGLTEESYALEEYSLSRKIEAAGINTPRAFEIVQVGDSLGLIYERIVNKQSISRLCAPNAESLEKYGYIFGEEARKFHQLPCSEGDFPSRKMDITKALDQGLFYSKYTKKRLLSFLEEYPDRATLLHGDLQSGNLIIADGKLYWIDLGTVGWGNPILDLGCTYFFYKNPFGKIVARNLVHLKGKQLDDFWEAFAKGYSKLDDISQFNHEARRSVIPYLVFTVNFENYPKILKRIFEIAINIMARKYEL